MFIANWKMNGSQSSVTDWLEGVSKDLDKSIQTKCVFCPPVCFLNEAFQIVKRRKLNISLGAQNIDINNLSPLTGGVNAKMLKELGSEYVIIGHSERRVFFNEDKEILLDKLKSASKEELKIIFCVGESLKEKEENRTMKVLKDQLEVLNFAELNEFTVAYEPIWAIGSGQAAQLDYIKNVHTEIIDHIKTFNKDGFLGVSYGGSVDPLISEDILSLEEVEGLLIGGASLKYEEFCKIVLSGNKK